MNDLVIVGAGQSAAQCIMTLKRNGFEKPIILIGEENHLPYQRPPLSKDFLSEEVGLERVYMKSQDFYDQNNVTVNKSTSVLTIEREDKTISLSDGKILSYQNLVLATGSRVRRLKVKGSDLNNIQYLRTIDNSDAIKEGFKRDKKIVIIGAGYIGLEVAAVAVKKRMKVTVIEMANRVMNRTVDPIISGHFDELHRENGVEIILNSTLEKFEGEKDVKAVVCKDGTKIEADLVVVGVGIQPNQEVAESAGLKCSNGILVDEFCRTEDPHIFACGDCTNHPNFHLNKNIRLESVHNALEQAKTVALSLLGKPEKYDQVPWFWSDQYDQRLQIVGISGDHDEIVTRGSLKGGSFMLFYLKEGELIAADSINNPKDFLISKKLVANKLKISSDVLSDQSVDLKELIK